MRQITLKVNGRKVTFLEEELVAIVERYFNTQVMEEKTMETFPKPEEKEWFEVNLATIDKALFAEERTDKRQEDTRKLILKALDRVESNPEKYAKCFKIVLPEKLWAEKTIAQLKQVALTIGEHVADWVEQALEWAQRISNGETWEAICNEPDCSKWHRLIIGENGQAYIGGGVLKGTVIDFYSGFYMDNTELINVVPLVVKKVS